MKTHDDGANAQAQIVLALLKNYEIEESWSDEFKRYRAEMNVARWHNCREQGYSVGICPKKWRGNHAVTLAWAEDRNTDNIVVYEYKGFTLNPLTVHDMTTQPESWSGKHFAYGKWEEAADYIKNRLREVYFSEPVTES